MQSADDSDGMDIPVEHYVSSKKIKYVVLEKIGQGGYGAVYRIRPDPPTGKELAMKVEKKIESRNHTKLSMEILVMKTMKTVKSGATNHFPEMIDRTKKPNFSMIVMTLLGDNLADIKRGYNPPCFSLATGIAVAIQTLEGIEQLHRNGFIHRDIKPGNFSIGPTENERIIYILDFGLARKFCNDRREIKAPRENVIFKGTVKFAPLSCHKGIECGPKEDIESWIYMVVDCACPDGLPWKAEKKLPTVLKLKEEARQEAGRKAFFGPLPLAQMTKMLHYIDNLEYADSAHIDYEFFYKELRNVAKLLKLNLDDKYDWECDGNSVSESTESTGTRSETDPGGKTITSKDKKKKDRGKE